MKAWILTAFYLWKDIWSRWLETPGALFARLSVAMLLAALLLLAQAAFILAGRSLESRIGRLGARTLFVSEVVTPDNASSASLASLLTPLSDRADVIALRQISVRAVDEFGQDYNTMLYGPETLAALAPIFAEGKNYPAHLATRALPPGIPVRVEVDGVDFPAITITPPSWFERFGSVRPFVLLPMETGASWAQIGYFDFAAVTVKDEGPGALKKVADALRALLSLDQRNNAQLQSPEALLGELDQLQSLRGRWQAGAGLAGGAVVALLFGSIAILEYRQNRFIVALLRSFGTPSPLLIARYTVEALVLMAVALIIARAALVAVHQPVFELAGIERGLLDRAVLDPYSWPEVWTQARWLLAGAALSICPVAIALRQPVGKILQ